MIFIRDLNRIYRRTKRKVNSRFMKHIQLIFILCLYVSFDIENKPI